jgi:hypothetical protein
MFIAGIVTEQYSQEQSSIEPMMAKANDTTISGMRYIIWVEPRTGDLFVVNATIDSIKATMFNNQLQ